MLDLGSDNGIKVGQPVIDARGLVGQIVESVSGMLAEAGIARERIDTVFFTGGSSGIPALRNSVSAMLPNARHVEGNIFGSIGSGLAIEAMKRYGAMN